MNRSLGTFLIFLAVLLGGFALLLWWIGPVMVSLALDEERRTTPYYLLHLLDEQDPAAYFQEFSALLRQEEAQLLWRGRLAALHAGRSRDELADVAVVEFGAGAGVVQMMTSSAYRNLTGRARPILLGTPDAPGPIAQDEVLLLWLLETVADDEPVDLSLLTKSAEPFRGQVIWSTEVAVLEGDRSWNHILLMAFPDPKSVRDWLADPETETDRALSRRHYVAEALMELRPG